MFVKARKMGKKSRDKWVRREQDERMTPFERSFIPQSEIEALRKALLERGTDPEEIEKAIKEESTAEIYINNIYQVSKNRDSSIPKSSTNWPDMVHLSIKRRDRKPIHDWRHLQHIKNELVGPENEAVELYPKESRLMDTANQYHLYVLTDPEKSFPFGYRCERSVTEDSVGKSKQRKFND